MALEKGLMCSVERFISLQVREVMQVNCCSGTKVALTNLRELMGEVEGSSIAVD